MHNKFLIAAALAATATVTGTAGAGFAQDMPADGPGPNLVIEVADEGGGQDAACIGFRNAARTQVEQGVGVELADSGAMRGLYFVRVDHQHRGLHDHQNLRELFRRGPVRHRDRDGARRHRAEMQRDDVRRVEHHHAHAIVGLNTRLAQARRELADPHRQRAIAQRLAGAQERRVVGSGDLQPVQQAIFDRVHRINGASGRPRVGGDDFDHFDSGMRGRQHPAELEPGLVEQRLILRHGALAAAGEQHDVQVEPAARARRVVGRHGLFQHDDTRRRLHGAPHVGEHLQAVVVVVVVVAVISLDRAIIFFKKRKFNQKKTFR